MLYELLTSLEQKQLIVILIFNLHNLLYDLTISCRPMYVLSLAVKGVGRKFFRKWGATEKISKNSQKRPKIALLSLFRGGRGARIKRPKNSTIKPLFTVFVPCMKIQGGPCPPALRCRHPC